MSVSVAKVKKLAAKVHNCDKINTSGAAWSHDQSQGMDHVTGLHHWCLFFEPSLWNLEPTLHNYETSQHNFEPSPQRNRQDRLIQACLCDSHLTKYFNTFNMLACIWLIAVFRFSTIFVYHLIEESASKLVWRLIFGPNVLKNTTLIKVCIWK